MQGQAGHDVIAIIMAMLYMRSAGRNEAFYHESLVRLDAQASRLQLTEPFIWCYSVHVVL